jgi:hypothetical protein
MGRENVLLLGASPKPERYSNKAFHKLRENGHEVIPLNPRYEEIEGTPCLSEIADVSENIDTVSVYVGPDRLKPMLDDLIKLSPSRVILNPGTESTEVVKKLEEADIPVQKACTLVLLSSGRFSKETA